MDWQLAKTASPGLMITMFCRRCCALHVESCQLRASSTQAVVRPSSLLLKLSKMLGAGLRGERRLVDFEL
jgi:hypothetical protein